LSIFMIKNIEKHQPWDTLLFQIGAAYRTAERKWREASKLHNEQHSFTTRIQNITDEINQTSFQTTLNEIEQIKRDLDLKQDEKKKTTEQVGALSEEVQSLQREIDDFEREKERKTKEMKEQIKKEQVQLKKMKKNIKGAADQKRQLQQGIKNANEDLEKFHTKTKELEAEIQQCNEKLNQANENLKTKDEKYVKKQEEYFNAQKEVDAERGEVEALKDTVHNFEKRIDELNDSIQTITIEIKRINDQKEKATTWITKLENEHQWINEEKEHFAKAGGDFDFEEWPNITVRKKLKEAEEALRKMDGKINKQVQQQFQRNNEEAKELRKKKKLVEDDRTTLEQVIKDLEKKKRDAVLNVHAKVNENFGKIFSKLLPGTMAKLVAKDGGTIHDGLEIRVAFGNEWRESLSELSGGQKSLLSLSLILALLKFNPAPMYILDEIDSALDLSHTQNIGIMLKHYFRTSQFIVVSLKPGLFQNANVIFKTRLMHGVSAVDRTYGATN